MSKPKQPPIDQGLNAPSFASQDDALDFPGPAITDTPQPLRVKLGNERFELRSLDDMTPGQIIILRLLMPQRNLPLVIADENDVRVTKLAQSVDKCLEIIAPELAKQGISFIKKLDVLDFYEANTTGLIRQPKSKGKGKGKGKRPANAPATITSTETTSERSRNEFSG